MEIDVGKVVAGKYELLRLLGRGAMGEVWVARHSTLQEPMAIKFVTPERELSGEGDTLVKRFLFEAQVAANLSRKTRHIVSVTDHGVDDGIAYLVMELLQGDTVEALVERGGPRPLPEVALVVAQAARGLAIAHQQGVLHRDLKAANLFLARDEDGKALLKILDFGIARSLQGPRLTAKGMVMGSPAYMSPEQALGFSSLDRRCDLWALAVVVYEALTGELPNDPEHPEAWLERARSGVYVPVLERRPELPRGLEDFFRRSFARDIAARFDTAASFAAAFQTAVEGGAPEPPTRGATTAEPGSRDPRVKASVAIFALVVLSGLVVAVLSVIRPAPEHAQAPSGFASTRFADLPLPLGDVPSAPSSSPLPPNDIPAVAATSSSTPAPKLPLAAPNRTHAPVRSSTDRPSAEKERPDAGRPPGNRDEVF
jgi:eukaryotic-like serine/threonine-protein kinase